MRNKFSLGDILIYNQKGSFFNSDNQPHPQNCIIGFDRKNGVLFPRYEARVLEGNGIESEVFTSETISKPNLRIFIPHHLIRPYLEEDSILLQGDEIDKNILRKTRFPYEVKSLFSIKKSQLYIPDSIQVRLI